MRQNVAALCQCDKVSRPALRAVNVT